MVGERHSTRPKSVTDNVIVTIMVADTSDSHMYIVTIGREGHFVFVGILHNVKTDYDQIIDT